MLGGIIHLACELFVARPFLMEEKRDYVICKVWFILIYKQFARPMEIVYRLLLEPSGRSTVAALPLIVA